MVLSKSRISIGSTLLPSLPKLRWMCLLKLFPTKVPCTSAENCFLPGILAERRATHHFCLPVQPESAPTRQPWHGSSSRLSWLHDGDFLISLRWLFHEWSSVTMISVQSFKVTKMTLTICQARTPYCTETLGNLKIYYTLMLLSYSLNPIQSESVLLPLLPRNLWCYEASYATLSRCVFPKDFHCQPIDPLRWSCLSKPRLCDFSTLSESHVCDKSQDDFVKIRRHFTGTAGVYSSDSEQQKKVCLKSLNHLFTTKHSTETINLQLQGLQGCQNSERHWGCKVRLEQKCRPSLCVWSELGIASHAKSVTAHWVLL